MGYIEKFQSAFNKCVGDTRTELDVIECFEQYCSEEIADPVEQEECFGQAKFIERCHTCSELKLEELHERKGILDPEIMSKICAECTEEFAGFEQPFDKLDALMSKFRTSNGRTLTRYDIRHDSKCTSIDTCTELILNGKNITIVPSEIGNLKQLQLLWLDSNRLSSLPPEIFDLHQLKDLGLDHNQLQILPQKIGNLQELEILSLIENKLKNLPPEIGNLQQLKILELPDNQLQSLPPEIGNLQQLKEFWATSNQLKNLPPEIGKLQQLKELWLSNNQLKSLPPEIGNLQELQKFWINNNRLESLPSEMKKLAKLRDFKTSNNIKLPKKQRININNHKDVQEFLQSL